MLDELIILLKHELIIEGLLPLRHLFLLIIELLLLESRQHVLLFIIFLFIQGASLGAGHFVSFGPVVSEVFLIPSLQHNVDQKPLQKTVIWFFFEFQLLASFQVATELIKFKMLPDELIGKSLT